MPAKDLLIDPAEYADRPVLYDRETVCRYNPQRYEMQQLDGILMEDGQRHMCVGFKDLRPDEFWVRGHMPGMPLMPGVLMVEAAAQTCSFYTHKYQLLGEGVMVGFGGIDEVRFRDPVLPGSRLLIAAALVKVRARQLCVCQFQAFVGESLVCEGRIKGIALPTEALTSETAA